MFKRCLVNQVLTELTNKGKSIHVVDRYLRRFYGLECSLPTLTRRLFFLKVQGKLKDAHTHRNY